LNLHGFLIACPLSGCPPLSVAASGRVDILPIGIICRNGSTRIFNFMTLIDRLTRFLLPAMPASDIGDFPFVASDVALYRRTLDRDGGVLDAQTWDDMLLPQYSAQLARGTSILGQQELHRRLHAPADGGAQVSASAARVRTLVDDGEQRRQLLTACEGLRRADREVSEALFGPEPAPTPRWAAWLPWLPVAFAVGRAGAGERLFAAVGRDTGIVVVAVAGADALWRGGGGMGTHPRDAAADAARAYAAI
jgi:hypothetical protein